MATLRVTLRQMLENDATLAALLVGGIFDASELDITGETASTSPKESDGVTIKPHAVIRWRAANIYGPIKIGGEQETVEIYLYDDPSHAYATIESAVGRVIVLLHDKYLTVTDRVLAHVSKSFVSGELPAPELGEAAGRFVRFGIIQVR